jgi:hypothetical protein
MARPAREGGAAGARGPGSVSLWEVRLCVVGGQTRAGELVDRRTLDSMAPLVVGRPVSIHILPGDLLGHPPGDEAGARVGTITAARVIQGAALWGIAEITVPDVESFLERAERAGSLPRRCGLSMLVKGWIPSQHGYEGDSWLIHKVLSVDVVDIPAAGGCFVQSCAAADRGVPAPELPSLAPRARPALHVRRESRSPQSPATVIPIRTGSAPLPGYVPLEPEAVRQ